MAARTNSRTYYDGDWTAPSQAGSLVFWWDDKSLSRLYSQRVQQFAAFWQQEALDLVGPNGGFLVSASKPRDVGAGILEWERTFADVPPSRTITETTSWPFQVVIGTDSGGTVTYDIAEVPLGSTAIAQYDYFHTTQAYNPNVVPYTIAPRYVKIGTQVYLVGVLPAAGSPTAPAQDSQITQWKGNIYVRKNLSVYVPSLNPANSASLSSGYTGTAPALGLTPGGLAAALGVPGGWAPDPASSQFEAAAAELSQF